MMKSGQYLPHTLRSSCNPLIDVDEQGLVRHIFNEVQSQQKILKWTKLGPG